MANVARNLSAEVSVEERIIRLEDQVSFVRSDASDIKASVRLLDIKIESTRDALQSVDKSVTTLSANVDRIDGKVEALESRMDRFENAITTRIDEKTSALAARLDQTDKKIDETKAILIERIDNRAALLDERIDSVFERNFLRGTAALIGAVPVMFGAFRFLQRTSLDADQIIGVTVLAGVLIWAVAFFATRRKSQRKVSAG